MSKAVVFFADGTEECEALLVVDLLRRAKVEVIVASAMGRRELVSSHNIHLTADALAEEVDYSDVDMVVLPGGIPGTPNLAANKTVTDTCVSFAKSGKKVAAIISGGNIDISTISALIDKALIARGRVFCFSVQLPDKPGQLLHVSQVLADENANVIKLEHNQSKVTDSFKKVMLEVTVETHGHDHVQRIIRALENAGFVVDKIY